MSSMNMAEVNTEPKILPGDLALWLLIFMELLVFGLFFISYAITRMNNIELFNHYQLTLNREFAVVNTLLLISSSYFVIRAVHAIRLNKVRLCIDWLYAAVLSGFAFLLVKSFEYYDKFLEGITLSTNVFYMFYLSLTLFHCLHVILGLMILLAVIVKAKRGHYDGQNYLGVESGASYWHMVDLVWIILFPLVYILR